MGATIRISTAAELVAAVPALLGFVPEESMIAVILRGNRILFTVRHDIAAITTADTAAKLAEIIADNGGDRVLLIGVSVEATIDAHDEMVGHLARYGIGVGRKIEVATCERATEYIDYLTGETGMTGDYRVSDNTTAHAVEAGQVIAASRADFARVFALGTEPAPVATGPIDPEWTAQEMAATVSLNTDPGPELAARFGALIANVKIRDAMLRLGVDNAGTAAVVMARTAAHLRSDARARVLTLAVFFFYRAGNGAAAAIAIDTTTTEGLTPTSLMTLLDRSLQVGMTPDKLNELMPTRDAASDYLGAPFPI